MPISRRRPAPRLASPDSGPGPGPGPGVGSGSGPAFPAGSRRRPPPTTRGRLLRRVVTALAAGLAIVLLGRLGLLDKLGVGPGAQVDWTKDYQLVEYLRGRVVRDGLAPAPKDCLLFIINGNDPADSVRMRVMQKHSGSCPPAPPGTDALPQLFTLLVNRTDRTVQDDAGSPDHFRPLP